MLSLASTSCWTPPGTIRPTSAAATLSPAASSHSAAARRFCSASLRTSPAVSHHRRETSFLLTSLFLGLPRRSGMVQLADSASAQLPSSVHLMASGSSRGGKRGGSMAAVASLGDYSSITAAAYGAALLAGGLFAYARTGSKGSLGGAVTGGALFAVTFYLLQASESASTGAALGFGSALLFSAVFAIRLFATGKPVPAGPLLAVSVFATAVFASAYFG